MRRLLPFVLAAGALAAMAALSLRRAPTTAPEPPAAAAAPTPAPTPAAAPAPAPADGEALPGGLIERGQALLTGARPPGAADTTVTAGSKPGTLLVTGHAKPGLDPVDAWRRPLHELRELFTGLPGLRGVEYALQVGNDRKATLRLDRDVIERMRLVKELDAMHGKREHLMQEKSEGKLAPAAYDARLRDLERATFSDLLVMIPQADRDIAPELRFP
jgi:hypothetical protein